MRMSRAHLLLASMAGALALTGSVGGVAHASSKQSAIFQDDGMLLGGGDAVRQRSLDEIHALGATTIKFYLKWSDVAPRARTKPKGFNGASIASYSSARFVAYDALVRETQARGMRVQIALTGPAPGWATAKRGDTQGVDRPSAREFRRFAQAMGTRYDGAHGVPRVNYWTVWNEPNNPRFLYPAATRRRTAKSPHVYRNLVQGAVKGLRASGHRHDTILFGELLPVGPRKLFRKNNIRPLLFMREMFCLDGRFHRFRGAAARRRGCQHFHRFTGLSGFAYHPYARNNGPSRRIAGRDNASFAVLGRVTRTLDRAYKRKRFSKRKAKLYITEFGFQSNPPDTFQTRLSRIPGFLNEAEWIAYHNRRVASYSQYLLTDVPSGRSLRELGATWQGGLRFANGQAKPGVYNAYRSPIFVTRLGTVGATVWGSARAGGRGTRVQVQQKVGKHGYRNLGHSFLVGNARGYFSKRFKLSKAGKRRYRFVYTVGGARYTSRAAKALIRL